MVLLDAFGSMSFYSRSFVNFVRGLIGRWLHADAFLFHIRLVDIADALRERDPNVAMARLSLMADGFGGGTRRATSLAGGSDRGLTGLPIFPSAIGNLMLFLPVDLPMFKQSDAICADYLSHLRRIRLRTLLSNLIRDESGVTAIEYALIAALIAVAAIAAFTLVGTNLSTTFSTIAAKL